MQKIVKIIPKSIVRIAKARRWASQNMNLECIWLQKKRYYVLCRIGEENSITRNS